MSTLQIYLTGNTKDDADKKLIQLADYIRKL